VVRLRHDHQLLGLDLRAIHRKWICGPAGQRHPDRTCEQPDLLFSEFTQLMSRRQLRDEPELRMECKPAINDEHRSGQWITQSAIHRATRQTYLVLSSTNLTICHSRNCGGQWQRQLQLPGAGFSIHSGKGLSRPGSRRMHTCRRPYLFGFGLVLAVGAALCSFGLVNTATPTSPVR